jgi:uncharacterized RDD family membrane protein YckC
MYCQNCGYPINAVPAESASQLRTYAGFWRRFAALIIDAAILSAGTGILTAISFGGGAIVVFFGPWIYEALMLSSEWRATVGKRALSIVVTRSDGSRLSFGRATGRHFAKYISALLLFFGYFMAAFTAKKQALHDMIADTVVVDAN